MIVTFYSVLDEPVRTSLLKRLFSVLAGDGFSVLTVDVDVERARLSAGRGGRSGALEILDDAGWEQFFVDRDGAVRVEALRDEWLAAYDFVLVDSATGTGHASGVSTIQLADAIVVCVGGNAGHLDEIVAIVDQVQRSRQTFDYDRPPATIVPVPIPSTSTDHDGAEELAAYCGSWLPRSASAVDMVRSLTVLVADPIAGIEPDAAAPTDGAVERVATLIGEVLTHLRRRGRTGGALVPGGAQLAAWPTVDPLPAPLMKLREWDPAVASEAELASWLRAHNSALAADLPDDPPWGMDRLRDYLTVTMPGERRFTWLAEDANSPGVVLGYSRMLMLDGVGVIELYVTPQARRQRVGEVLLGAIAERAVMEGFTSLGVEAIGDTPAIDFYRAHTFTHAHTEMRSILDLATVDWTHLTEMAKGVAHGYRIEYYPNDLPDELLPAYAEAKQVRRLDPDGELELRPSSYDAERLRASLRYLQGRGLRPHIVVAIHERTETVAGLTELVVPAFRPSRGDQYDTVIVPEHNNYGLARVIKARMLLELRIAEPNLSEVQTWHAADRELLQQVNKELGFRPDREWREYEVDASDLAERLRKA